MPRSDRDTYDDHVAALARQLGIHLGDLTAAERRRLLQDARQRHLNAHEAAVAVGYRRVHALLDEDVERARVLVDRLDLVSREWEHDDLVDAERVAPLEREARARLRESSR